jgi:hypothetical protein
MELARYLQELQSLPPEQPLEPELKQHQRQELDKTIRWAARPAGSSGAGGGRRSRARGMHRA